MAAFERAKAKFYKYLGDFLGLRSKLLKMRSDLEYLARKADKTGNVQLRAAVRDLLDETNKAYEKQGALEGKVQSALMKIRGVEAATRADGTTGAAVTAAVIIAATGAAAVAVAAVIIHTRKVNYLHRLIDEVKNKSLTAAEAADLAGGAGLLPGLPMLGGGLAALAAVGFGLWVMTRPRPARK
jgi:hypothetical protein